MVQSYGVFLTHTIAQMGHSAYHNDGILKNNGVFFCLLLVYSYLCRGNFILKHL